MGQASLNIAVFASGNGSNFQALLDARKRGVFKAAIALLVCDNPKARVLQRARKAQVKVALVKREDFASKTDFEQEIIRILKQEKIDLIVLAGFMRLLGGDLLRAYRNRIINIHPALLPAFKGAHGIADAYAYGVKVTGVTVHFVDEKMDHGPIILQEAVAIVEGDSLKSLEEKIHAAEHRLYPRAVKLITEGALKLKGRKVCVVRK
ncbi:MAG: phosphoribosylglycinamide formyltransferase [Candidatus Omnitrophica bacterium]|nr:phosphoribosylglycinamide formyltransferase [Candidatus Omnitrophota bacterium]